MNYIKDHHYVYKCDYHVIFCPKYRRKILENGVDIRLKELFEKYAKNKNIEILEMEIMPDHVHLLLSTHPKDNILDIIKSFKKQSASTLKKEFPYLKSKVPCIWTRSCFISTVGSVSLDVVKQYIENQKKV